MGGFLGIGHSSEKTDRAAQLAAQQGEWNVFNQGLATGTGMQTRGTAALGNADQYFKNLLMGGRTQTAQLAQPAIQATTQQADASRRQQAALGTSRTGGAVAENAQAGTATRSKIDDIISSTLMGGREEGAKGEMQIGSTELNNAMAQLGLGAGAVSNIMENATDSREISNKINSQTQEQWGQLAGVVLMAAMA